MAGGCRDCSKCTESAAVTLIWMPWRIVGGIIGALTVNWFKRKCPQCGHLMQYHQKIAGRLAD
jgi:hypothetical protein